MPRGLRRPDSAAETDVCAYHRRLPGMKRRSLDCDIWLKLDTFQPFTPFGIVYRPSPSG
ncbi:hypothetical protein BVIET440_70234 [Burkholderia vietnamiensis]